MSSMLGAGVSSIGDLIAGMSLCWLAMQMLKVICSVVGAAHGLLTREFVLFKAHRDFDKIQMRADPENTGSHLLECEVMWRTKMKVGNE